MVECLVADENVIGSNPISCSKAAIAQSGRGMGFKIPQVWVRIPVAVPNHGDMNDVETNRP